AIGLLDLRSGATTVLIRHPKNIVAQPHFSPDGRWIALHSDLSPVQVRLFVMSFRERSLPAESDWIPLTDGVGVDRDACWSSDGRLLYFFSARDGFRCIWAQRLDPATKRPVGPPVSILHLHSGRRSMTNVNISLLGISVARDKLVLPLGEVTGDIWMAK